MKAAQLMRACCFCTLLAIAAQLCKSNVRAYQASTTAGTQSSTDEKPQLVVQVGHSYYVHSAAFSADQKYVLTASYDKTARLWEVETAREVRKFEGHSGYVWSAVFSPDQRYVLTTGDDKTVRIWEMETGREVRRFEGHSYYVKSAVFSPDQKYVLTASWDSTTRLWDIASGKELCRLISFRDGTWAVVTSDGHFDASSLEEIKGLHWIMPDDTMKPLPLEIFQRDYYEPRLLPRLLNGEKFKPIRSLSELNRVQPPLQQANPEDLVLISFSSHGYADNNGNFFFVLSDTGPGMGEKITEALLEKLSPKFLSSEELSLWLRDVDAGEMLMIVDACHSAAAVAGREFKPGPMGSRGLGQLSYDKGMRILTATQVADVAYGIGTLKQGLLTYVLVKDGIEAGKADFKPVDRRITVSEWLEYGEQGVPKLLEVVGTKAKQADAPVELKDLVQKTSSDIKTQRPSLFDFSRKRRNSILQVIQ
jgi:WD40 domain-containing protein